MQTDKEKKDAAFINFLLMSWYPGQHGLAQAMESCSIKGEHTRGYLFCVAARVELVISKTLKSVAVSNEKIRALVNEQELLDLQKEWEEFVEATAEEKQKKERSIKARAATLYALIVKARKKRTMVIEGPKAPGED